MNLSSTLFEWSRTVTGAGAVIDERSAQALVRYIVELDFGCDNYYVETRLSSLPQTDLLLAFERYSPNLTRLQQRVRRLARDAAPASQSAWRTAEQFLERWLSPADPLHEAVSTVWLEFDDVLRPLSEAAPSLSACAVPAYSACFEPRKANAPAIAGALQIAHRALCGADGNSTDFQRMNMAIERLPSNGRFIHLSHMAARNSADVKLYGVVPRAEFVTYLERIGFAGNLARLAELLNSLYTRELCGEDLYFDLNLSNMHSPRRASLGLAFSQQQVVAAASQEGDRSALLARLRGIGLCDAAQASALAEWGAYGSQSGSWSKPWVRRWLDLKCVMNASGELESKAYLGFAQRRSPFAVASLPHPIEHAPP